MEKKDMIITICGSIAFYEQMKDVQSALEANGHTVYIPMATIKGEHNEPISIEDYYTIRQQEHPADSWVWKRKTEAVLEHYKKIEQSDAILVLNYEKKGIPGYIGANTLMEMGLALYLEKKIFLFHEIPKISYKEEILAMQPILINGDIEQVV